MCKGVCVRVRVCVCSVDVLCPSSLLFVANEDSIDNPGFLYPQIMHYDYLSHKNTNLFFASVCWTEKNEMFPQHQDHPHVPSVSDFHFLYQRTIGQSLMLCGFPSWWPLAGWASLPGRNTAMNRFMKPPNLRLNL